MPAESAALAKHGASSCLSAGKQERATGVSGSQQSFKLAGVSAGMQASRFR